MSGSNGNSSIQLFGEVKNVRQDNGFAFIKGSSITPGPIDPATGEPWEDHFLHRSEYEGDFSQLCVGHKLYFQHKTHPKGARAVKARLATS